MTIKVALAGAGAFGIKHLDGIKNIADVEVISLISRDQSKTDEVAARYGIAHTSTKLEDALAIKEVDAVILCTPTQMHAGQTLACLDAGKHVEVEIPMCDVFADGQKIIERQQATGLVTHGASTPAISGYTRKLQQAISTFNKWMSKPTFFGAPT